MSTTDDEIETANLTTLSPIQEFYWDDGDPVGVKGTINGKRYPFFIVKLAKWLNQGLAPSIAIVGDTGKGKSISALRLAEILHTDLDLMAGEFDPESQLVYEARPYLEEINQIPMPEDEGDEKNPHRKCFIFDEAGVNLNSKDYHSPMNRAVDESLQTMRVKNCLSIFVTPKVRNLDKAVRDDLDFVINMLQPGFGRVTRLKLLHDRFDNKDRWGSKWEFWRKNYKKPMNGRLELPREELLKAYKDKEYRFKGDNIEEKIEELKEEEKEDEDDVIDPADLLN